MRTIKALISQPNIPYSVSNRKSNTRTEIPVKFNKTSPAHNRSSVSSKVYLANANRFWRKDVLKPRPIATYNLTHKAAKTPNVKVNIRKLSNIQLSIVSANVIGSLHLNTHKQRSSANIRKPSRSVTKLSHLKDPNISHQKLHHYGGLDTKNILANHLRNKSNHLWWKHHVKKF